MKPAYHFPAFLQPLLAVWLVCAFAIFPLSAGAENSATDSSSIAVSAVPSVADILKVQRENVKKLSDKLAALNKRYEEEQSSDRSLTEIRQDLQALNSKLIEVGLVFRGPLQDVSLKLDQLGVPQAGQNEDETVTAERQALTKQKAAINSLMGDTENLYIASNRLIETAAITRRELFASALTQRVAYDEEFFVQFATAAKDVSSSLLILLTAFSRWIIQFKLWPFLTSIGLGLIACGAVLWFGLNMMRKVARNVYEDEGGVAYLRKLMYALLSAIVPTVAVSVLFLISIFFFNYNNLLWGDIEIIFRAFGRLCFVVVMIASLAIALFHSSARELTLVDVTPKAGRRLIWNLTAIALCVGLDWLFDAIYRVAAAPLSMTVAKNLLNVVVVSLLLIWMAFIKPSKGEGKCRFVPFPRIIRFLIVMMGLVPLVLALLGYVGLARFIVLQIVVSGAFVILMYLGFVTSRAISAEGAFSRTLFGRWLIRRFDINHTTLDQWGLLVGVLLGISVLATCFPPILMQFGFSGAEIWSGIVQLLTGFQIGHVSISLTGILIGILFFSVSWFLIRWFINWFDSTVLTRGRVDAGVRNSIRTVAGYGGVAIAAIIGMSSAGFNLSSLALIAGGLSLGIGFGLQNIVQNFVSGLILLVERPFRVGDYVEAGSVNGTVNRISVRATEIETYQMTTVIVPNSTLINGNVSNWTLRNKLGRTNLSFTLPAEGPPLELGQKLLDIVGTINLILKKPAPWMEFTFFDAHSYVFTVYFYISDITSSVGAKNAVRAAVFKEFFAPKPEAIAEGEGDESREDEEAKAIQGGKKNEDKTA